MKMYTYLQVIRRKGGLKASQRPLGFRQIAENDDRSSLNNAGGCGATKNPIYIH